MNISLEQNCIKSSLKGWNIFSYKRLLPQEWNGKNLAHKICERPLFPVVF